ncbi:MBL fold metallo-hydrolase [Candidatus Nitronereus thalassa]|uniref:MBL fold metallo-hydrolase n=1 Tax=Candidatus Nitronereus thalassa TaxID=3020898 RepID=A0ABU3K752_9BACT|nr:MBL fold metallo-hydrolase [Candidatus Nitronereus thalassa]MDT7042187.1 MBL fold metallo-hydrolase [Candidatus Nitronereus thalassa]
MPLEDEFCDIVKKARSGLAYSVEQVSEHATLSRTDWESLEKGVRMPSAAEVEATANVLSLKSRALNAVAIELWEPIPSPSWLETAVITVRGEIGGYEVKGYVLFDAGTKEAVFIDTAYNAKAMLAEVKSRGFKLVGVCLTHGHTDHAGGLDSILKEWPVPVYLGNGDFPLLPWKPEKEKLVVPHNGQKISVGSLTVTCLATPGHTPGGFCFQVSLVDHKICFVGDTLFAGSIGRSNPFSLYPEHLQSVRGCVLQLPDETVLLPGHGPATTVKEEKIHNPFG